MCKVPSTVSCPELTCSDLLIPFLLPVPFPGDIYLVLLVKAGGSAGQDWGFLFLVTLLVVECTLHSCSSQRLLSITLFLQHLPKLKILTIVY